MIPQTTKNQVTYTHAHFQYLNPISSKSNIFKILGIERTDCGKVKNVIINPARGTHDTFGKLISNAIGDVYVDPGQYNLRKEC